MINVHKLQSLEGLLATVGLTLVNVKSAGR